MVGLYNLEPHTNIALEKIRMYYENHGEEVEDYMPIAHTKYNNIFCSSLFTFSPKSYVTDDMICGGTGFDLTTVLSPEIEAMRPKINMGFTTRGCIRKCAFCVVPEKEGKIKATGDIYDFWDRKNKEIIVLDNNILALPDHFKMIASQIKRENLKVDFNQGLDFRLMNRELLRLAKEIKMPIWRFAWDNMKDLRMVRAFLQMLKEEEIKNTRWYVLIGFDTSEEEDLERVTILKKHGHDPFVMPYNKYDAYQRKFARWVNHKAIFKSVEWKDYK